MSPPRRPWALINWLFWSCLLLYPLGLLLAQLISSGSMLTIFASVAFCSAGWFHALMSEVKPPWNRYNGPSFSLTSSFLSKRFIKQQIWQLKCKSPFLENTICQSWEHVPNSFQACACLAKLNIHLNTEMLIGEMISLTAWIHKEHVTVSTINKCPCLWLRCKWQILFYSMLSTFWKVSVYFELKNLHTFMGKFTKFKKEFTVEITMCWTGSQTSHHIFVTCLNIIIVNLTFLNLLFTASLGVRWMIGQTEIKKGSSYGNKEAPLNNN